jgi:hypothetical protein
MASIIYHPNRYSFFSTKISERREYRHLQTFLERRTVWHLVKHEELGPWRPDRCEKINERYYLRFKKRHRRERTRHWNEKNTPGGRCPGCFLYIGELSPTYPAYDIGEEWEEDEDEDGTYKAGEGDE